MASIAFLGVGLIGAGLAEAAARRGDTVSVWNRTAAKAHALEPHGVRVAPTAAQAVAGAERVHVALSDDPAVDTTLAACQDALGGALVIDHTTTAPAATAARASRLAERGIQFLHAPVFMSPQMCREARGIMLASGPEATYEHVKRALLAMTGKVEYLGERPDLAASYKLFGNAMIVSMVAGLADVFTMAKSLGIDAADALSLFSTFQPTGVLTFRGANMAGGNYQPSFELTMARKDVRLMLEAAGEGPLAALPAIAERMDALIRRGHGGDDLGVLAVDAVPKRS
jgi:3-hydroxyisobutyrate dehydrogenase